MLMRPWTTVDLSGPVWPLCQGTETIDQADLVKLGSVQLNPMSLHATVVRKLPVVEHKIDRNGGCSCEWQCLVDKPVDDDDDDALEWLCVKLFMQDGIYDVVSLHA